MSKDNVKFGPIFKGNKVEAKYREEENPLYRHNAFIEALPPLLKPKEAKNKMSRTPTYSEKMRTWPVLQRLDQVMSVAHLIVPLPDHLLLEQQVSRVIRNGYMCRNPLTAEWVKQINSGFEGLCIDDESQPPVIRSNASGFAIVGPSGSGKTTTVESVLGIYPQVIEHANFNNTPFVHNQLVWLKLECPSNGSTKALCHSFFSAVDEVMGDSKYLKTFGNRKRTKEDMMPDMARIARLHGLGVLVIDEIQRLNVAASGGAEEMMHFFTQLNNLIGVPVVLVGTSAALRLVMDKFSQARRSTGQGDGIWSPMAHRGAWDYFLGQLWKYQFTNTPTELTAELNAEMYRQSCGIIDLAVKLYMLVQWSAIGNSGESKKEVITRAIIKSVAKDKFGFVKPALDKLRGGGVDNAKYLDDLLPTRDLLGDYLAEARERIALGEILDTVTNQRENDKKDGEDRLLVNVVSLLAMAGYSKDISEEAARSAMDRHAEEMDLTIVSHEAMKVALELKTDQDAKAQRQNSSRVKRKKRADGKQVQSDDLREAVKAEDGASPHTALQKSGDVKSASEFLDGEEVA